VSGRIAGPWSQILDASAPGFTLDGHTFVIPARPARVWLRALASDDREAVVPGLLSRRDRERWAELYFAEDDDGWPLVTQQMHDAITEQVITEAAGMPHYAAVQLLSWAADQWRLFDSWCAERRLDPLGMPLDRLCNVAYGLIYQHQKDDNARTRLEFELFTPPKVDLSDPSSLPPQWTAEGEGQAFLQAMGQGRPQKRRMQADAPVG
jgi:hypothetical protein